MSMSELPPEHRSDIAKDKVLHPADAVYNSLAAKFAAESALASTGDQHAMTVNVPELGEVEINDYMDHEHTQEQHMQAGARVKLQRPILTINLPKTSAGGVNSYMVFRAGDLDTGGIMGSVFVQALGEAAFAEPNRTLYVRWQGNDRHLADPAQDPTLNKILDAMA